MREAAFGPPLSITEGPARDRAHYPLAALTATTSPRHQATLPGPFRVVPPRLAGKPQGERQMADQVGIKELLEAGVPFGHQTRRWNPKMRRYIFGERGGIHIIDLQKTEKLLATAQEFAGELAGRGGTVLFVGTKKQARDAIEEAAKKSGMPYVNQRWLGGLLTNFQTIS